MPFTSTFPQVDVPKCNVLKYLFPANEVPSDSPLYIDSNNPHHSLSPRQLLKWIKRLALGLENLGVERGHRVMIFTPNHIFVPVVYLGSVGSGRVFTGANPAYTATGLQLLSFVGIQQSRIRITNGAYPELAHQIKDTQASILFVYPENLPTARTAAKEAGLPTSRIFLFSDVVCAEIDGITDWRSILGGDDESARYSFDPIAGDEAIKTVATLNYSSGTTGLPKGVCISHHNLCANVAQSITVKYLYEKKSPLERGICFLPLYHAYGQLSVCLLAPKLQLPVYILKAFNFTEVLRVVQTYKITHLQVAPPVMVLLAKRPEIAQYDLSSLSHIVSGAAPLSRDLQNQVSEKFNVPVDQAWGMTELTCAGSGAPLGQRDKYAAWSAPSVARRR